MFSLGIFSGILTAFFFFVLLLGQRILSESLPFANPSADLRAGSARPFRASAPCVFLSLFADGGAFACISRLGRDLEFTLRCQPAELFHADANRRSQQGILSSGTEDCRSCRHLHDFYVVNCFLRDRYAPFFLPP